MKDVMTKKKIQLDKMIQQRRLMQTRLKEIYARNQKNKVSQKFCEEPFESPGSSSGVSGGSKSSFFGTTSKDSNQKGNGPSLGLYSTNFFNDDRSDKGMFGSTSSKKSQQQRRLSNNERSQNHRIPFFA